MLAQLLWDFNAEYDESTPSIATLERRLQALLAGDGFWAILAGVPAVGFATLAMRDSPYYEGRVAYLEDLYVVQDMRGTGIGSAIMALLITESERRGAGLVEIGVDEPDVDAMRFYVRHGFVHRDPETGDRAFHIYRELA
ncbi:hypothetical protein Dac01nite_11120 [Demequina activiva]|uniref:N-acetyltransferase domain-containing protein n=1 Tax=Demequina activiva TaxID=1582364 RepID=A0A919Q134_9MICO|nr:hypothetical protein Dac01nite_11120 [Demequina activiva]